MDGAGGGSSSSGGSGSAGGGSGGSDWPRAAARSRAMPWSTTSQVLPGLDGGRQGPLPRAATPTPVSGSP